MKLRNPARWSFFLAGGVALLTGCFSSAAPKDEESAMPTSKSFYFIMDSEKQRDFLNKVNEIKVGEDIAKIRNVLGEPTYDETGTDKKTGKFKARILSYYLRKWDKNTVNEKRDFLVYAIFDEKGKLTRIMESGTRVSESKVNPTSQQ